MNKNNTCFVFFPVGYKSGGAKHALDKHQ